MPEVYLFPKTGAPRGIARALNSVALTVYKIDYSPVDEKPEVLFMYLKGLVGERGFEPPTPWSRTRCSTRLSHSPTEGWFPNFTTPHSFRPLSGHENPRTTRKRHCGACRSRY